MVLPRWPIVQAAQTVIAALSATLLLRWIVPDMMVWGAVSAPLVIRPDRASSRLAGLGRTGANAIGALAGFAMALSLGVNALTAALAMGIAVLACYVVRLGENSRAAAACTAVLMLGGPFDVHRAFQRVGAVLLGSLVGLVVTELSSLIASARSGWDRTSAGKE